jgi:hypothetical protein
MEGAMNTTYLFPILVTFMIAALAALGYALQRIGNTSHLRGGSPDEAQMCPHCGQRRGISMNRCSICGRSLSELSLLPGETRYYSDDVHAPAHH